MRSIDPIERDHEDLYRSCVGQTHSNNKRQMLLDMTERVVAAGTAYCDALDIGRSDTVTKMAMSDAEEEEIAKLYDYRLVAKTGIERKTYDAIRTLVGTCPFCGFGEVYEVDHYLPQTDFPDLNILPKNLVPICHPCNHIKLHNPPEAADKNLLHPYFDALPDERWLFAELSIQNGGPVLDYYVNLDAAHGALSARLAYHFEKLELSARMRNQSAQILVELEDAIDVHLEDLATDGMKEHFRSEGRRILRLHGNTMEMAANFAAAENDQYCSGKHKN